MERFRLILIEVDEDFTEAELDDIIAEVWWMPFLFTKCFPPSRSILTGQEQSISRNLSKS